jgi:coenzyme F420-reducing hydrogenase delta subunit
MHSSDNKGPILAFFCNWAPYRCYMDVCKSGNTLPHSIYPIKVMCTGRIDPAMVLFAFEKGAEGVVVIGCKENECRYGPGPGQANKMLRAVQRLIHILGLEPERFSTLAYSFDEESRLFEEMDAFAQRISGIKKSPLA